MAKTNIVKFTYEGFPFRVVDRDGNPWFYLAEVCRVLKISNPSQAASRLDEDEKATLTNDEGRPGSGAQSFTIINESGLYSLILTSRKREAKRFMGDGGSAALDPQDRRLWPAFPGGDRRHRQRHPCQANSAKR